MITKEPQNEVIESMIAKNEDSRVWGNSDVYFDIINNYLNSIISKKAKIVFKEDGYGSKIIKIYDDYYNDENPRLIGRDAKYHEIEWENYDECNSPTDMANIRVTLHYKAKRGKGDATHNAYVDMLTKYAKQIFDHAGNIACLNSVLK